MNLYRYAALGLLSSLLAVGSAAAHGPGGAMPGNSGMGTDCPGFGMMQQGDGKWEPTRYAQQHLADLKAKLNLTQGQEAAWTSFSEQVMAQAKNMATFHDDMRKTMQNMPKTAPERMEMMASRMKDRADRMKTMADAVKTFYDTLTPEQKSTFDQMQMKHMGKDGYAHCMQR